MKQSQFLDVVSPEEAWRRWTERLDLAPRAPERVLLPAALGRVLAEDVLAPGDVPAFDRSNVDGFAVRATDTFAASEARPARLRLLEGTIAAGQAPHVEVGSGEAVAIATGAMLPRGADAVVMVEDTDLDPLGPLLVQRPCVPGGMVGAAGSDIARGEALLRAGTRLTARETGTLAACGLDHALVRPPVRVAVFSTGDEIVPPGSPLAPGQVHDANATLLTDAARELGAEAEPLGIAPDDEQELERFFDRTLAEYDAVVLSGGTSKGGGDLSYRVLAERAEIVVHGVALKPGKPLCLAAFGGKPVAVLPGFPTSALFTFHTFVAPVLRTLLGVAPDARGQVTARLARHHASERGRAEFTLVALVRGRDDLLAFPLGKGSGSVTAFARADGFFQVPAATEYLEAGDEVEVVLLGRDLRPADLVIAGSHCTGVDLLLGLEGMEGLTGKVIAVGSRGGLDAAARGACDLAPVHLFDPETGAYNESFVGPGVRLLRGYGRRQGLAYRPDQADVFGADADPEGVDDAFRRAVARTDLRMANRGPATGTRALAEHLLAGHAQRPPGWTTAYRTHTGVAAAIAQGRADYGVCLEQVARGQGLAWRPLADERLDFLVPEERWDAPGVRTFRSLLESEAARTALAQAGFSP